MKKNLLLFFGVCLIQIADAQKVHPVLDHVAIYASDYNKSIKFYHAVFEFDTIKVPFNPGFQVTWYKAGPHLMLHVAEGAKDIVQTNHSHIAFRVDSVELFAKKLNNLHIPWYSTKAGIIATRPDGIKNFYFKDPDGYEF